MKPKQAQKVSNTNYSRQTTIKQLAMKPIVPAAAAATTASTTTAINNKIVDSKPSGELKHINSLPTIFTTGFNDNSNNITPKLISAK